MSSFLSQVGFNAGDGVNFFAVEGSRTQRVINVTRLSNVDIPGRWMFRVDNAQIESAGCERNLPQGTEFNPDMFCTCYLLSDTGPGIPTNFLKLASGELLLASPLPMCLMLIDFNPKIG